MHFIDNMATKLTLQASEILFKETKIPDLLLKEIEEFKKRNMIVKDKCCPSCLKAHLIKKASVLKIDKRLYDNILNEMNGDVGHNGYYLDANNLKRI